MRTEISAAVLNDIEPLVPEIIFKLPFFKCVVFEMYNVHTQSTFLCKLDFFSRIQSIWNTVNLRVKIVFVINKHCWKISWFGFIIKIVLKTLKSRSYKYKDDFKCIVSCSPCILKIVADLNASGVYPNHHRLSPLLVHWWKPKMADCYW